MKTESPRLAEARKKLEQAKARVQALDARESTLQKNKRDRAMALLGVLLEADLKRSEQPEIEPLISASKNLLRAHDAVFLSDWLRAQFPAASEKSENTDET